MDRGRLGSKYHIAVDRNGIPLAVTLTAGNVNDCTEFPNVLAQLPAFRHRHGRRSWRPEKLHADKGYDTRKRHAELRRLRIKDRIVRRGEKTEKLGRYRWVVERTFAWLHSFRRLAIRYERSAVIHSAFLLLACSLLCAYNL